MEPRCSRSVERSLMIHPRILILPVCRIERDRGRNRAIFQTNPGLDFILHCVLIQENLTCATSCISITSVPGVPAIAHINSIALQVLIDSVTVPFETPAQVSNWPAALSRLTGTYQSFL